VVKPGENVPASLAAHPPEKAGCVGVRRVLTLAGVLHCACSGHYGYCCVWLMKTGF